MGTVVKSLVDMIAVETGAIKSFGALVLAKKKGADANTQAVESKMKRVGSVGVEIVELEEDLDDLGKALIKDGKLLAERRQRTMTRSPIVGKSWTRPRTTSSTWKVKSPTSETLSGGPLTHSKR